MLAACASKVSAPPEPPMSVRRGDQAFRYEEYEAAIDAYRTYIEQSQKDEYTARVFYKTALAQYRLGRYRDAVATLDGLAQRYPRAHWVQVEALRGDCERALSHPLAAVRSWDTAWKAGNDTDRMKLRERIVTAIRDMSELDLQRARQGVDSKDVKKLIERQLALRQAPTISEPMPEPEEEPHRGKVAAAALAKSVEPTEEAEEAEPAAVVVPTPRQPPQKVAEAPAQPHAAVPAPEPATRPSIGWTAAAPADGFTEEPMAEDSAEAATERSGSQPAAPAPQAPVRETIAPGIPKVGCLVPLSGPAQEFGQRTLRGLQLVFGQNSDRLIVKDTAGDRDTAVRMFEEFSQDPNVLVVIGPLRSEEADAVAPLAESRHLPLLLLSQQDGLGGTYALQTGMTRSRQVGTLLDYAMDKIRLRRFGVLYPKDTYGEEFLSAFKAEVERRGGTVVGTGGYPPGARGLAVGEVRRWRTSQDLQAVFLPDDAAAATQLARFLQREMPDVTLLGVHGWEGLADQTRGSALSGVLFTDGFYVGSSRPATREFVSRFVHVFGSTPSVLEAQAYDAALLTQRGLESGTNSRSRLLGRLLDLGPLEGATGELLITPDGVRHRLFLLQVSDGKLQEIG